MVAAEVAGVVDDLLDGTRSEILIAEGYLLLILYIDGPLALNYIPTTLRCAT